MGAIKQRRRNANFLKVSGVFEIMGTGFSDLDESPSAQTSSKKYINDKNATKSITGYDWSTAFTTDQIRSLKAIDFICNIGEMQLTGADAETEYVVVDLDVPGTVENTFKARKFKVAVEVANFKNADGDMTADGNLLGIGDFVLGTFNTVTSIFTETFTPLTLGTLTVASIAGTTTGTTKLTVTPILTVGSSYVYKTDASVIFPLINEVVTSAYTAWNGTADIVAVTGNEILIVEIDASNKAKKAGIVTVVSKA